MYSSPPVDPNFQKKELKKLTTLPADALSKMLTVSRKALEADTDAEMRKEALESLAGNPETYVFFSLASWFHDQTNLVDGSGRGVKVDFSSGLSVHEAL